MVPEAGGSVVLSDYSPDSSVSDILGKPSWRILEQWRADSRLVLQYYKIHVVPVTYKIQ